MCNLYSITTNQAAIIALFRVLNRYVGNLPPMPGVFPDYPAPVVRNTDNGTELVTMRWGMPPPPRTGGPPVTNIRNTSSPHWRGRRMSCGSLSMRAVRCSPFAGIWTTFNGDRGTKSKPIPGSHNVYGFLTTAPNAMVA